MLTQAFLHDSFQITLFFFCCFFVRFPLRSPKILIEWIKFTNRGTNWKPSRWNSICSRHFDKSDFREYLSRKCLKKDAIPTIVTKNNISYETYHISSGSPEDTRTLQSEHDDFNPLYGVSIADDSKTSSELFETCRLCGERADNLTCVPLRALDDPEINHMLRKCLPAVNIHVNMDQSRVICLDCGGQLRQFSDFIDKVLVYQREMGLCENFDSFVVSDNNFVNCNQSKCCIKSSTPNPSTAVFIKQEPINVKQEIVDNRRPFTVQLPMLSPSLCLNPFAESKKIKGLMQQEINSPKSEIGSTYCRDCDRIFVNNHEFRSHKCSNAEQSDREQGNNCEIMEVITLNNPVSFIDLAEDENATNLEPRKLKIEGFGEFQQRMRLEFEHAYAKRATSASCNLKQEIIDSYNDSSQNGYENQCHLAENDEQMFNQNSFIEDTHCIYFDCSKCNQSFVSQELHDEHLANMHPLKHKICAICNAEFKSSFEYLIHKSKVHTQRFQCRQCKQKFNTQTILRFHERLCTRQSKDSCIPCRRCGKSMRNLASMKRHLNICIEKQTEIKDERQHQSQKVPQEQTLSRFTCDICDLTFSRLKHFVSSDFSIWTIFIQNTYTLRFFWEYFRSSTRSCILVRVTRQKSWSL